MQGQLGYYTPSAEREREREGDISRVWCEVFLASPGIHCNQNGLCLLNLNSKREPVNLVLYFLVLLEFFFFVFFLKSHLT